MPTAFNNKAQYYITMLTYGSVCSGIEAATVAWHTLGWKPAWFSEILKFPNDVLQHRYPDVPNLGDMTTIYDKQPFIDEPIDLLVGGTPCQSFSVQGLRKGLEDPRGNLMLEFLRIADAKRPRWLLWENVPGVVSGKRGRNFGVFLGALRELGYFGAWRVLDAQYFGVPQNRRRVFVVGHRGNWRPPAEVLFESNSLPGSPAPNKEVQQESAAGAVGCPSGGDENLLAFGHQEGRSFKCSTLANPLTVCQTQAVVQRWGLHQIGRARKFTPLEYERLMGFPDDYTLIPGKGSNALRYKALGNSMAVPVMRWLGERINLYDDGGC